MTLPTDLDERLIRVFSDKTELDILHLDFARWHIKEYERLKKANPRSRDYNPYLAIAESELRLAELAGLDAAKEREKINGYLAQDRGV